MNSKFSPSKNARLGRNSPTGEIGREIGEPRRLDVLAAGAQLVDRPPARPDQGIVLGLGEAARVDPNWGGPTIPTTGYIFAAGVYWLFCFGMSRYSQYTEHRLSAGRKH